LINQLLNKKKEATQEFFNKKRSTSAATPNKGPAAQFTFNKAPMNKDTAKKEFMDDQKKREKPEKKRSAFTAKLYKDDDELENLKILGGDQFDSDLDEKQGAKVKPRDAKAAAKTKQDFRGTSTAVSTIKIGRLNLTKGSVAMFAVSEFHQGQYAVVSHTRNVKGYLSLKARPDVQLEVGQMIIAAV